MTEHSGVEPIEGEARPETTLEWWDRKTAGNTDLATKAIRAAIVVSERLNESEARIAELEAEVAGLREIESMTLDQFEGHAVMRALNAADGNVTMAARSMGVSRSTFYRLMDRRGITVTRPARAALANQPATGGE